MKRPMLARLSPFHLAPVRLVAAPAAEADVRSDIPTESGNEPRWIQIAEEGAFEGHLSGPFEMNKELFDQLITNFHGNPSFKPGADGVGTARVIAYDFHHASEDPASAVAVLGAPAQAWALDLETRKGADGLGLWALTELLEPMATYASQGKYRWTSVAIWPKATDPRSGEEIGWYLSSIAFTNDPFIQGMVPIAAKRGFGLGYGYDPYDQPDSLDDVVEAIKGILEMPATSTVDDIAAELGKLRIYTEGTTPPPAGVDTDRLMGRLRQMLNLPTLASADEVFAQLEQVLVMAQGVPAPEPAPAAPAMPPAAAPAMQTRNNMQLLKLLAGRFGLPATEDEVQTAVLAALDEGQAASTTLSKLLGLLGVKNLEQATAKLQELIGFKDLMPTIEGLLEGQIGIEEIDVEEDVEKVAATYGTHPSMKFALRAARVGSVPELKLDGCLLPTASGQSPLDIRRAARDTFRAQYPEAFVASGQSHLLAAIATDAPKSPVLRAMTASGGGVSMGATRAQAAHPAPQPGTHASADETQARAIMACVGRNHIEKAMAFLRSQPGGEKASQDDIHEGACLLSRRLELHRRSA